MTMKDRAGLAGFMLAVSGAAMALSALADVLSGSFGLAGEGPLHAMISVAVCALPISWFVGTRLMQLRRLKDQLEITSRFDGLTGLLNRPSFMDMLAEMPPRQGALALIDVDFFKRVNDTHGHFVGDEVLAHVARLLSETCRPGDLICRFGGEEFAVLFADATPEHARRLAEAMVRRVAAGQLHAGGASHAMTVSLGYAMRDGRTDPTQALHRADEALYRAKAQGRNRAVADWEKAPVRILPAA